MARTLRVEYPGAIYHVMNRGDHRENIFLDDEDRACFLSTLAEACRKTEWRVLAYCWMPNHFHLVIETPQGNLVAGMKWLLGVYTKRFNIRHKLCGHLFAGRYKALIVEGGGDGYLATVCDYVHLNPVRAGLLERSQSLESFMWSSYPDYLKRPQARPPWLQVNRLLGEKGIPADTPAGRKEFARRTERRRQEDTSADDRSLRSGWCLGSEDFRRELLAAAAGAIGPNHYGAERFETGREKANRMIAQELKRLGWGAEELRRSRKGAAQKVELARLLREETTMTLAWIAERLSMGSWGYVAHLLNGKRKSANIKD